MEIKPEQRKWLYGIIVVLVLCIFGVWCFTRENNKDKAVLAEDELKNSPKTSDVSDQGEIYVHITGAVANPGVVKLPSGSRMIDAIENRGGMTENANSDSVNLAAILKDEDKIHIDTKDEVLGETKADTAEVLKKVNINQATAEELKTLPGVGDVLAKSILDYRQKNGNFKNSEELKNVDRIGDKVYEKLKDSISL
ncbi:MAG: helix-hairpin-helix domain-containing protein [Eubacterium sp.]